MRRVIYDVGNITSIVNSTVAQFNALTLQYTVARPCLINITNQLTNINATVVVLPSSVNVGLYPISIISRVPDVRSELP